MYTYASKLTVAALLAVTAAVPSAFAEYSGTLFETKRTQTLSQMRETANFRAYNTSRSSNRASTGWFPSTPRAISTGPRQVSFPRSYAPGQIVVSFADRRLYHIVARGRAVAYPVASPRPQSRWSGTLTISQKRKNPTWTPTPQMRRENPRLPAVVKGGDPRNPLGNRRSIWGRRFTASTERMRRGQLGVRSQKVASACTTRMSPNFITASTSARA